MCGGANGACKQTNIYWSFVGDKGNLTCAHRNSNDPECSTIIERFFDITTFEYSSTAIINVDIVNYTVDTLPPSIAPTIGPIPTSEPTISPTTPGIGIIRHYCADVMSMFA